MDYRKICTMEKGDTRFEVRLYNKGSFGDCRLCPFFHPNFCTHYCGSVAFDFDINPMRTFLVRL